MWKSHGAYRCRATHSDCHTMQRYRCSGIPAVLGALVYQHTKDTIKCIVSFPDTYSNTITLEGKGGITIPSSMIGIPMGKFDDGTVERIGNIDVILFMEVE